MQHGRRTSAQRGAVGIDSAGATVDAQVGFDGAAVVIDEGADGLGVADRGAVGGARQVDEEGLVALDLGVAVDGHRDGERIDPGAERKGVGGGRVVAVGHRGTAIGAGVLDAEGGAAPGAGHGEDRLRGAAVAFGDLQVGDRHRTGYRGGARHRDRHRVGGVVGFAGLVDHTADVGDRPEVVGARGEVAGQRQRGVAQLVPARSAGRGERERAGGREQRVRGGDRRIGGQIDAGLGGGRRGLAVVDHVVVQHGRRTSAQRGAVGIDSAGATVDAQVGFDIVRTHRRYRVATGSCAKVHRAEVEGAIDAGGEVDQRVQRTATIIVPRHPLAIGSEKVQVRIDQTACGARERKVVVDARAQHHPKQVGIGGDLDRALQGRPIDSQYARRVGRPGVIVGHRRRRRAEVVGGGAAYPGIAIARQVGNRTRRQVHVIARAIGEIGRRVDRDRRAAEADLACVEKTDRARHRSVGGQDLQAARARPYRLAEGQHKIGRGRDAVGIVRGRQGVEERRGSIRQRRRQGIGTCAGLVIHGAQVVNTRGGCGVTDARIVRSATVVVVGGNLDRRAVKNQIGISQTAARANQVEQIGAAGAQRHLEQVGVVGDLDRALGGRAINQHLPSGAGREREVVDRTGRAGAEVISGGTGDAREGIAREIAQYAAGDVHVVAAIGGEIGGRIDRDRAASDAHLRAIGDRDAARHAAVGVEDQKVAVAGLHRFAEDEHQVRRRCDHSGVIGGCGAGQRGRVGIGGAAADREVVGACACDSGEGITRLVLEGACRQVHVVGRAQA